LVVTNNINITFFRWSYCFYQRIGYRSIHLHPFLKSGIENDKRDFRDISVLS
jgi:hypothetical protein